jgi:hypothetical protein
VCFCLFPPDSYFYFYNNKNKKAISQKVTQKITRSIGQGVPPDSYFYFYNNKNKKAISQKVTQKIRGGKKRIKIEATQKKKSYFNII